MKKIGGQVTSKALSEWISQGMMEMKATDIQALKRPAGNQYEGV